MQKAVYRVRSQGQIIGRLALDMLRDARTGARRETLGKLHHARAG
jgi:hypothetical protein